MNRSRAGSTLAAAAPALAALLFCLLGLPGRAAAQSQPGRPLVPSNLAQPAPPAQPIPYSHKTHLALGLTCEGCHTNPEPGNQMTFPASAVCMQCHATVAADKPAIRKLAGYAQSGTPVPWIRVYAVTPGVQWTHRKHVAADMKCETCHGQVAQMDVMAETTSVTAMAVCISCHQANNAKTACNTCHLWP